MWIKQINPEKFGLLVGIILMMLTRTFCENQPCLNHNQRLFSSENRILKNFAYRKKSTFSYVMCGRDCIMDKNCKSFNFLPCQNLCELNNDTRAGHLEGFLEEQGSVYFDSDEDTPFFSLKTSSLGCYRSCKELLEAGFNKSDVYTIYMEDGFYVDVYCDMETDGGGWIVFQRRLDGSEDFYRNWTAYKTGFGNLLGEFWLGNDNLLRLTSVDPIWELRVDMTDWDDLVAFAKYKSFKVTGEMYILHVEDFYINSSAADSLTYHNGRPFTTVDNDNDRLAEDNCARKYQGAWWFNKCVLSHLNGVYYQTDEVANYQGVLWSVEAYWKQNTSQKRCTMKIRETKS